ncbi:UDP-2,3-diacylglucosamine diphosphatase [Noviherbaspirillum galbum]|uniref:UDP-2,3-diacylglucosamine hydrolase n=1 Tax=Noviherbaspirillum galbum TaxID=2709383 RepID=A0A6B3SUR8_9BURK|nr:UDP-2,3-diacylglucosamine diphosphatase [Noviherbaspirillum galbum]NEX62636.1 UDP-2,3-diacylglucosamine diphosphatase [Noviherbaspirillum galbum]
MIQASGEAQPVVALFVSDVHLHEGIPRTTDAFLRFLDGPALHASHVYLLGDIFEYWAGDDDIDGGYNAGIVAALRRLSDSGVKLYWMAGNRDFLVGEEFAYRAGMTLLGDPTVVEHAGLRIVLAHGDAACTDDTDYMRFRAQVRDPSWQQRFLAMPLAERKAIIDGMRDGSRQAQRQKTMDIMDVNAGAIDALFASSGATVLVHGHTHRPAVHEGRGVVRHVLPDWDCDGAIPRGGWLALREDGVFVRVGVEG